MPVQKFATRVQKNVKNMQSTEWSIAAGVPKFAEDAPKNAGR
jgi:hypothetical protein